MARFAMLQYSVVKEHDFPDELLIYKWTSLSFQDFGPIITLSPLSLFRSNAQDEERVSVCLNPLDGLRLGSLPKLR